MPTNIGSQNVRVSSGLLNTVSDDFPGGGSVLPGFAPGQLGQRVTLGLQEVKYSTAIGTLYEGTYQYVISNSCNALIQARGLLAFWTNRSLYVVAPDDSVGQEVAGVYINVISPAGTLKAGYIQAIQGGRCLVRCSNGAVAAGDVVFANQGAGTAIASSATVGAITAAQLCARIGKAQGGILAGGFVLTALDVQQS